MKDTLYKNRPPAVTEEYRNICACFAIANKQQAMKARRAHTAPDCDNIADCCLRRLHKKGTRLLFAGKHPKTVKIACAREMVGFVWESLCNVAA